MKKIELLAPVGNMECLKAAIMGGCDAVYLGGYQFGARSFAGNFSLDELKEAVTLSHLYGVKVYVTVNTLIYENEVTQFMFYIEDLIKCGVDALIIQDLGMLDLVHKTYPELELHASTQMHIHSLNGVKMAERLGCKRVVLARETSIDTIKEIRANTDLELEIFVHGALCVSYSGQCLMSSLIGGRSGNRGTCAGTCRKPYKLVRKNNKNLEIIDSGYLLSMKDLNTLNNLDKLLDTNVDSLKIEGRMKRPSYVYAVISLYRKVLDMYYRGLKITITKEEIDNLAKIFSRGYTKGFLFNEDNNLITNSFRPNHMGVEIGKVIKVDGNFCLIKLSGNLNIHDGIRIVGRDDLGLIVNVFDIDGKIVKKAIIGDVIRIKIPKKIEVGSKVLKTTDQEQLDKIDVEINSNQRKVMIDGVLTAKLNKPLTLIISDGINNVKVTGEKVTKASKRPTTKEECLEKIMKLGNTVYQFNSIDINIDDNIFIPIKFLNELRREATDLLNSKRTIIKKYSKHNYEINLPMISISEGYTISIKNTEQLKDISSKKWLNIYGYKNLYQNSLITPRLFRIESNESVDKDEVLIGSVGDVLKNYNYMISDVFFNVTNSYTIALLHSLGVKRITLSYELDNNQIKEIVLAYYERYHAYPNLELIIYAKEEMMVSKFSLINKYNLNNDDIFLLDEYNNLYPVYNEYDYMNIYNHKARVIKTIDYYKKLQIKTFRIQVLDKEDIEFIKDNIN